MAGCAAWYRAAHPAGGPCGITPAALLQNRLGCPPAGVFQAAVSRPVHLPDRPLSVRSWLSPSMSVSDCRPRWRDQRARRHHRRQPGWPCESSFVQRMWASRRVGAIQVPEISGCGSSRNAGIQRVYSVPARGGSAARNPRIRRGAALKWCYAMPDPGSVPEFANLLVGGPARRHRRPVRLDPALPALSRSALVTAAPAATQIPSSGAGSSMRQWSVK